MSFVSGTEGQRLKVLDDDLRLVLRSASSPGQMSVMTVAVAPGSGVPPHAHRTEEEAYYLLEGALDFTLGDEERRLGPGDFAHVPPGTLHGYRSAGPATARFLAWTIGGPIDRFFVDMSQRVRAMPQDAPAMAELMERYGIRMAGGAPDGA